MLLFALIATLISSAYGQTRYVIDGYEAPVVGSRLWAYPLDLCVNTGIDTTFFTPSYGIFACNQAGDTVTLTSYGTDSSCAADSAQATTRDITDTSLFRCIGEDNYASSIACTRAGNTPPLAFGGNTCCKPESSSLTQTGCLTTTLATGVCYSPNSDGNYTMSSCDDMDEIIGVYNESTCTVGIPVVGTTIDECEYLETVPLLNYDAYRKLSSCVVAGDEITNDTYCPYITDMPTSMPTANPTTAAPTSNPTTSAPTPVDESKAAALYVASLLIAVIGFAVYM